MKILQLTTKPPMPPVDGGTRAMLSATTALLDSGCEVKVLSMSSGKHGVDWQQMPTHYRDATRFEAVPVDLRATPAGALSALLTRRSYNIERFRSKTFRQRMEEVLRSETFDVVQLESLYLMPYVATVRQWSKAAVVLRAHNVEWQIWEQMHRTAPHSPKRWYLGTLARSLQQYEQEHINDCDGVVFISPDDQTAYLRAGLRKPHTVIPYGIEMPQMETDATNNVFDKQEQCELAPIVAARKRGCEGTSHPVKLFHIGAMDWQPNIEAIRWLLDKVWPEVHRRMPDIELHLAGRRMPEWLRQQAPQGVVVEGEVADASRFVAAGDICVVPLLSGSGMRVKIVEAMAHGKPVVATSRAAQGMECKNGEHILIADNEQEFARQTMLCATDAELRQRIGSNARHLIEQKYSNKALSHLWTEFYQSTIDTLNL